MFVYLNVASGWRTAPSRMASSSNASSSGNGRLCAQKVASTPSRMTPAECETSSRTVASASGEPASASSGIHDPAVSSSRSLPASTSCMMAVAVKVLECEAIAEEMRGRQRFAGVDIRDAVRLAELDLAIEPDRHLRAGGAELPDAVVEPGIDIGKRLAQDIDR